MTSTNLEKLREAIVKAVPDLKDWNDEAFANVKDFSKEKSGCSCHISAPCGHCTHPGNPDNLNEDDFIILPITLEDVLRAIDSKYTAKFFVNCNGTIIDTSEMKRNTVCWTLGLPLDQQPQETIDFLATIFV